MQVVGGRVVVGPPFLGEAFCGCGFDLVEVEEGGNGWRRRLVSGGTDFCCALHGLREGFRIDGAESCFGWEVLFDCARRVDRVVWQY